MKCRHRQRKSRKPGSIHLGYIFRLIIMVAIVQCPHNVNAHLNQGKPTCPNGEFYSENVGHCMGCPTAIDDCEREDARDKEECKNSCRNVEPSTTKPVPTPTRKTMSRTTKRRVLNSISNTNKPETRNGKDKVGKLFGTICGTLLGTTLIVAVLYCTYRKCRRHSQTQEPPIPTNARQQEPAWIGQERIVHAERLSVIGSNVILSEQNETEM